MSRSVTQTPCECNYLQRMADNPDMPIEYDARLNEYHFVFQGYGGKNELQIYHCPFCGGKAPESKRDTLFHTLTLEERSRLIALTRSLDTLGAVLQSLGPPDQDDASGLVSTHPETDGKPPITRSYRTLLYQRLSETANVLVTVYPIEKVSISFQGKYKGGAETGEGGSGLGP